MKTNISTLGGRGKLYMTIKEKWRNYHHITSQHSTRICTNLRKNFACTEYTECQAFSPVVRIGSPPPAPSPTSERCISPPLFPKGGTHSLAGEWTGELSRTKGQTLWNSMYSIIPPGLRASRQRSHHFTYSFFN